MPIIIFIYTHTSCKHFPEYYKICFSLTDQTGLVLISLDRIVQSSSSEIIE